MGGRMVRELTMHREATTRASESPVAGGPCAPRTGLTPEALADSRTMNTDTPYPDKGNGHPF